VERGGIGVVLVRGPAGSWVVETVAHGGAAHLSGAAPSPRPLAFLLAQLASG
jgi:hypothetical protein